MEKIKRDKDNIGWRYCLTMMLMCLMLGALGHNIWVRYMDSRYARVWEANKIRTLDYCSRMTKLALAVVSTNRPGSVELENWFRTQTAEARVPADLLQDYQVWQVMSATSAAVAQLEYLELKERLPETDPLRDNFERFGELIDERYADTGRPIRSD